MFPAVGLRAVLRAAGAAVIALATASTGSLFAQDRPNVVLFIADDLGLGDLAPYGQDRIRTPHLSALAEGGVLFERAYAAAPVCAPSRCAILTGLHAGHCSVRRNRQPNVALALSDPTLGDALRAAGYRTAFVGKWGLGGESEPGLSFARWSAPWELGFGRTAVFLDDEIAATPFPPGVWRDGRYEPILENAAARGRWIADVTSTDALATLDTLVSEGAPFLLVVASTLPHREIFAPDTASHAGDPWPEVERAYAAMVERLDADVGAIRERLREHGALDTTLFVFTSDHGPNDGDGHEVEFFGSTRGLRGQKRDLYEGGVRVPLLVAGPGVPEATRLEGPVSLVDLLPTLLEVGAAPAPDGLDGESFVPLFSGSEAPPRAFFFGAAEANGGHEPPTRYALLDWPLVLVEREDGVSELYDLAADPGERIDLAAARFADVERLRALRIAESTGSIVRSDPVLAIAGEELAEPVPRPAVLVLDLDLTGAPPYGSRVIFPALAALGVGVEAGVDGTSLDRREGDHLVVAAHPAVSFGDESFGVEARLALRSLANSAERAERQWLAVLKPTGTPDGAIDWGVLVQAADAGVSEASPSPGALALVFGRGRLREDDVWIVRSRLGITDTEPHELAVRFDAIGRRVTFELDGARDELALGEDLGHVRSDGPLVIGAHHSASGAFDEGLDGAITSFRLVRGAGPAEPEPPPRELTLEVGSLIVGGPAVEHRFRVVSTAAAPSRAMSLDVRDPLDDARVEWVLDRDVVLGSTDEGADLVVRVTPSRAGELDATIDLVGTALRLGHAAIGSPIRLRIRGRVGAPASPAPTFSIGVIEAAALLAALGLVALAVRRRAR